jgi:hypothetical protein
MARRGSLVAAILLLAGGVTVWLRYLEPMRRHRECCERVRADLASLAKRRPPNVSLKQWENVVAWTLNAHGNCLASEPNIPPEEIARFERELKLRLSGPVRLKTIDWIWDEIVRLSSGGQRYSDNWRPTLPERLKEFEEGGIDWGIKVD